MGTTTELNNEQELYVIHFESGYTCHGYEVVEQLIERYTVEMKSIGIAVPQTDSIRGTIARYEHYQHLCEVIRESGRRLTCELYRPFIGHEGKRVEVTYKFNDHRETTRFYIGKSTGHIPCHLEIKKLNSSGGVAIMADNIESFKFLAGSRR